MGSEMCIRDSLQGLLSKLQEPTSGHRPQGTITLILLPRHPTCILLHAVLQDIALLESLIADTTVMSAICQCCKQALDHATSAHQTLGIHYRLIVLVNHRVPHR